VLEIEVLKLVEITNNLSQPSRVGDDCEVKVKVSAR
jgi:hypothetical protein